MFKKILQSLAKSQQAKTQVPPARQPSGPMPLAPTGAPSRAASSSAETKSSAASPEELCEISPKMSKDQIAARLKLLYRRFNRSASSLDPRVRDEAEKMLNAIVLVREKHFGEI